MIAVCFTKQGVFPGLLGASKRFAPFSVSRHPKASSSLGRNVDARHIGSRLKVLVVTYRRGIAHWFVLELLNCHLSTRGLEHAQERQPALYSEEEFFLINRG